MSLDQHAKLPVAAATSYARRGSNDVATAAESFAHFAHGMFNAELPRRGRDHVVTLFADHLGLQLACVTLPRSEAVADYFSSLSVVSGRATVVYHGRRTHPEHARAANLARRGVTGPVTVLDGGKGLFANAGGSRRLVAGLGEEYLITQVGLKIYNCRYFIHFIHAPLEATLGILRSNGWKADNIAHIDVYTPAHGSVQVGSITHHRAQVGGRFSTHLTLALALVTVTTHAGESRTRRVRFAKGTPQNPMSFDEIWAKFRASTAELLPELVADGIRDDLQGHRIATADRRVSRSVRRKASCRGVNPRHGRRRPPLHADRADPRHRPRTGTGRTDRRRDRCLRDERGLRAPAVVTGMQTMCEGGGLANATLIERLDH